MSARRRAVPAAAAAGAASRLADILFAQPAFASAQSVALYAALPDELPTADLARKIADRGLPISWPRISSDGGLEFAVAAVSELTPGRHGVPTPPASSPAQPLCEGVLWLLPGLAFDRRGARLGRGSGSYDRALAGARGAYPVGMAYAFQLVSRVPVEPHDLPVRALLSEAGWEEC